MHLRNLAECFLADEEFMAKFTTAPAGIKNHHAYNGGLLAHVVSLMEVCRVVAPLYPELDGDLLLLGAFLHDASKIDELVYEREMGYSDEGQLIGHIVMAVGLVEAKAERGRKARPARSSRANCCCGSSTSSSATTASTNSAAPSSP